MSPCRLLVCAHGCAPGCRRHDDRDLDEYNDWNKLR
jgi:hypothetical protein